MTALTSRLRHFTGITLSEATLALRVTTLVQEMKKRNARYGMVAAWRRWIAVVGISREIMDKIQPTLQTVRNYVICEIVKPGNLSSCCRDAERRQVSLARLISLIEKGESGNSRNNGACHSSF